MRISLLSIQSISGSHPSMPLFRVFRKTNHCGVMTDPPRVPSPYGTSSESQLHNLGRANSGHTPSLPSFASFEEHASRRDDADAADDAPTGALLTCYLCTKLKSMVEDVAVAVAELDESVHSAYQHSVSSVSSHLHALATWSYTTATFSAQS